MLIAGGGVAAWAAVWRRGARLASAAFAIALAVAGLALILEATEATLAACLLVVVGLVLLVLDRFETVSRLSWLDAAMGASAVGALAVSLGAGAVPAVAAGGAVGALALSRWRPGWAVLLAVAGLAALAGGAPLAPVAAPALAAAAWRREAPPGPAPSSAPWCSGRS